MYSVRNIGVVTVFAMLALVIGTVSAVDTTGFSVHGNGTFFMGAGFHGHAGNITRQTQMIQSSLTKLGQQGVDVTEPQADIAGGNISAAQGRITPLLLMDAISPNRLASSFGAIAPRPGAFSGSRRRPEAKSSVNTMAIQHCRMGSCTGEPWI